MSRRLSPRLTEIYITVIDTPTVDDIAILVEHDSFGRRRGPAMSHQSVLRVA